MAELPLDRIIERIAEEVVRNPGNARRLPLILCREWPDAPALELVIALSSAARALEKLFAEGGQAYRDAVDCWRMAALLACDVHAAACIGAPHRTGRDIEGYWRAHDPYFLIP